jgi:hypothetical protein
MLEVIPSSRKYFEYLLGVIQGDGNIVFNYWKEKKYPSGISIAVGYDDADYAAKLVGIIDDTYEGIKAYTRNDESVIRVKFYNSGISRDFYKFKKKGIWALPELEYPEYYIAGLWDTDGNVGSSRRTHMRLSVKRSGNLELVKPILEGIGFDRVKVVPHLTKNKLGIFPMEKISFSSKKHALLFEKSIPIQHPRKEIELAEKTKDFLTIKGRRGHKEMCELVVNYISRNPGCTSNDMAKMLSKTNGTYITKELLRYTKQGFIKRQEVKHCFRYYPVDTQTTLA